MHKPKKQITIPEREEEILKFWERKKIFEKSLTKTKKGKEFVFYEGPPTANGMPGIHHVEARAFKDAVLRYKTMRGLHVPRRAGWDTHGLPVEIQVEKKLGFKTKHDIENFGIAKFNAEAKQSVWEYKEVWERLTRRMGFWVDMAHPYITYETPYIESLWWIIKEFWKKGLLYEDFKVVPWCPRCQTGLSSHEVGLGYQEDTDTAVYVKFKLLPNQKIGDFTTDDKTYILAWTTTPWTLPGNVGLALHKNLAYVLTSTVSFPRVPEGAAFKERKERKEHYIIAKEIFDKLWEPRGGIKDTFGNGDVRVKQFFGQSLRRIREVMGGDLTNIGYEPLFDVTELKKSDVAYKVHAADFVSATEGTGVVHTAVMYGEDDYKLGQQVGLPKHHTVTEDGKFIDGLGELSGLSVKAPETTKKILEILGNRIFHQEQYKHEYPHCWRCGTALLYYARRAWWVRTTAVKKELLANNEKINWVPEHLKHGRFGEFLRDVRDWCFSRERYWGTPLPIWQCEKCGEIEVIGSTAELKKRAGNLPHDAAKEIDLHRPYVDEIVFACLKKDCRGIMRRTPEVADVWFDSGAMPFAQSHYPFLSYETRSHRVGRLAFPADYICEGVDQTRGWFYSMLNVATLLGRGAPYKNVISMGILLDKDGQKMSKSKGNVVNPQEMADKYGMDALRWYFFTINSPGDEKRFEEKDVALRARGFVATLWNSFIFFDTYVTKISKPKSKIQKSKYILDQWIMAKLNMLVGQVTDGLNEYDLVGAARAIDEFTINDFSQWYVRRSRRRFQHPESIKEKDEAAAMMARVLLTLAELSAPFAPFIAEAVYQGLRKKMGLKEESVHLRLWPKRQRIKREELRLVLGAIKARRVVAEALKQRAHEGIKVRQPLKLLQISRIKYKQDRPILMVWEDVVKEEVNVEEIEFPFGVDDIKLDTEITPELREKGMVRELIRKIQDYRGDMELKPGQMVSMVQIKSEEAEENIFSRWKERIQQITCARELIIGGGRISGTGKARWFPPPQISERNTIQIAIRV